LRLDCHRRAIAAQLAAVSIERMAGKEKLHRTLRDDESSSLKNQAHLKQIYSKPQSFFPALPVSLPRF
jgi:hypothetical protein